MKYDKRLNGIWKCCTKEMSRYSLNSARFDSDLKTVVATDGHILTAVNVTDLIDKDEQSFCIPLEALKFAQTLLKKDSPVIRITAKKDAVVVSQGGMDLRMYYPKADAAFPKWESATPSTMEGYKGVVTLSAELLLALSDSLKGGESVNGVSLWIKDGASQIIVTHPRAKGKYAVMMPMRGQMMTPEKFWVKEAGEVKQEVA